MGHPLALPREEIRALCQAHGVRRLAVFGSATTDRFDPNRSDVDFLVEFRDDVPSRFDAYFGLKADLERVLNRDVDLVVERAVKNPFFAARAAASANEIYAA